MRTGLATTLLVVVALAGCAGKDVPPMDTSSASTSTAATLAASAALPEWDLGQGWTYSVERPGEATETFQMMVAEDRDDLWVVASNDRQQAINHAVYSTNPMLGRVGKETLSPFQSGAPVRMFQFPLTDGKTWKAEFFGEQMDFTAEYAGDIDASSINVARGLPKKVDGFRIEARGGGLTVDYDYVEAVEWFTSFQISQEDGTRSLKLTLRDLEDDYNGNYYFYRGARDADSLIKEKSATGAAPTSETYEANVPDGFKDFVALGVVYNGKAGTIPPAVALTLKKPDGTTALSQSFSGARETHFLKDTPGTAGKWTLQADFQGTFEFTARVFGISKYAEGSI